MVRIRHFARLRGHRCDLPLGSVGYENATNERGERVIWLEPHVVDRLGHVLSGRLRRNRHEVAKGRKLGLKGLLGNNRSPHNSRHCIASTKWVSPPVADTHGPRLKLADDVMRRVQRHGLLRDPRPEL